MAAPADDRRHDGADFRTEHAAELCTASEPIRSAFWQVTREVRPRRDPRLPNLSGGREEGVCWHADGSRQGGRVPLGGRALLFLYAVTPKGDWTVQLIPAPKKAHHLPVILRPEEVLRLLQAAPSF